MKSDVRAGGVKVAPSLFQESGGGSIPTSALQTRMFADPTNNGIILRGADREHAEQIIKSRHYTGSVPSGKSHFVGLGPAILVWSIPANQHIGSYLFGKRLDWNPVVWELSRLWAPDGHQPELLTRTIKVGVAIIKRLERPDALVSYADPNVGHLGGVYRAASWIYDGETDDTRVFEHPDGRRMTRRSFHSNGKNKTKAEVEAMGFTLKHGSGKHRFVKLISKNAKQLYS